MDLHLTLAEAFRLQGFVTTRQLHRALGVSRQAAWKRIRRMVQAGELLVHGAGRGVRYLPGPGAPSDRGGAIGTEDQDSFWRALADRTPDLTYVGVYFATRSTRRKKDAAALLRNVPTAGFVIVDFDRVEHVGDAFAQEIFCGMHAGCCTQLIAINASPGVRKVIDRVRRMDTIKWQHVPTV